MTSKMKGATPWVVSGLLGVVLLACIAGRAHADVTSDSNSGSNSDSRSNAVGIGGGNNSGNSTATGGGNNSGNSTSGSNSDANSRSNSTANGGTGTGGSAQAGGGSASQGQQQGQGQRQNSQSNATQGQDASNRNTIIIKNPAQPSETTANVNQNIHTDVSGTQSIKSAPPLGLGNLSPTTPCSNTYQLGVSGMGFGVGAGGVVVDGDCTRREYARILWAVGAQQAAVGMLCQNEELQRVAPVMCKTARDELGSGTRPNQDLPAYPSTKPVPPIAAATPEPKPAEVQAAKPVEPTVTGNPPGRAAIPASPAQGTIVQGSDGSNYKFVGNAWVKIVNERQPLVPDRFSALNLSTLMKAPNEVEGRTIE